MAFQRGKLYRTAQLVGIFLALYTEIAAYPVIDGTVGKIIGLKHIGRLVFAAQRIIIVGFFIGIILAVGIGIVEFYDLIQSHRLSIRGADDIAVGVGDLG